MSWSYAKGGWEIRRRRRLSLCDASGDQVALCGEALGRLAETTKRGFGSEKAARDANGPLRRDPVHGRKVPAAF
jgi:hypothetical protein